MSEDRFDFIFFFAVNKVRWRSEEIRAVFRCFLIGGNKRGVEDRVDLPLGGDAETECRSRDDFFDLKRTSSFHLEFLGSVHVEVGSFQPDLLSYFPRGVLGGYSLFHFLLGQFVGGLGVISSGG